MVRLRNEQHLLKRSDALACRHQLSADISEEDPL